MGSRSEAGSSDPKINEVCSGMQVEPLLFREKALRSSGEKLSLR